MSDPDRMTEKKEQERFGDGFVVPPDRVADPADVGSLDAIVTALYDVISGPAGPRDWARNRTLHHPDAGWHMPCGPRRDGADGTMTRVLTLDEFEEQAGRLLLEDDFHEVEVARRVERFGCIAHVFSTYESRRTPDGEPFVRGVNSIQLVHDGARWWVLTVMWDTERELQPLPAELLGGDA